MNLGRCFVKKLHLVKVGAFAWYSVKIRDIFGVRFQRRKVDLKKQSYTKTETCKLYSRIIWIFLPNVVKIDPYNFEVYRFKVCAFFLRHSVYIKIQSKKYSGVSNQYTSVTLRKNRSYCYTVWSDIRMILSSVRPSLCNAVHCGSQVRCTGL